MELMETSDNILPKVEKLDEIQDLNSDEENDENLYRIENKLIYYKNDLIIGRIVYQCYHCIHIFNNINDSINHFKQFHQNSNNNNLLNDNINCINDCVIKHNINDNYFKDLDQNQVKSHSFGSKTKSRKKSKDLRLNNNEKRSQIIYKSKKKGLRKRKPVFNYNKICINNGCDNSVDSEETNDLCNDCFESVFKLNEKTLLKNELKALYECEICGKSLSNEKLYLRHKKSHKLSFVCSTDDCNERFATYSALKDHNKTHLTNNEMRYTCNICGKFRKNLRQFQIHMRVHSNPIICEINGCNKKFATAYELKTHQNQHFKDQNRFKCDLCDKSYSLERKLREHHLLHTNPRVCDYLNCGKKFSTLTNLKIHQRIHSEETPFVCDWPGCEFATKAQSSLISHKARHNNDRRYHCDWPECDQSFGQKNSLESHIALQHKNERNFVCDFADCGKSYGTKIDLSKHKRCHVKLKQITCDWPNCGLKFMYNHMLKRHLVIHTGERPYPCNWPGCEAKFGLKGTLQTHKKLVHKCDYIRRSRWDNKNK